MKNPSAARRRSTAATPQFAVILDHHRATFPEHWPIARLGRSLAAAGAGRQYEAVIEVRPRSSWSARVCRRVKLVHVPTGAIHPGAICELTPRPRGTALRRTAALLALAAASLALGCAAPAVTKRYAAATWTTTATPAEFATVSAFVLPANADPGAAVLAGLGPQAQANFIKAMDDRSADAPELLRLLASSSAGPAAPPADDGVIDRTRFRRQVVFSLEKTDGLGPADRLETVTIRLTRPVGAAFASWNKFATHYESVDLGKLTLTRARSLEIGPSVGAGETTGSPVGGRADLKLNRTLAEELTLRHRYVALTGALQPEEARLTQEGAVGVDLAGNAAVELEIAAAPAPAPHDVLRVTGLDPAPRDGGRKPMPSVRRVALRYPARAAPITCGLAGRYRVRRVLSGAATMLEGDDNVAFVTGGFAPATVELVGADDLATRVWALRTADDQPVYVAGIGLAEFAAYADAATCCAAVRAGATAAIAGYELRVAGETGPALTKDQLAAVQVHVRRLN